ncbi:MAG: adenylate kinase family protein [Candidatus Hodarchaeota archaeon]
MNNLPPFKMYITGVPGTGKTKVARKLSQLQSLEYIEINSVVLDEGFYLGYDINRDSVIIDEDLLVLHLESLMANYRRLCLVGGVIPIKSSIDLVVVLRCRVPILRERLQARKYSNEKIEENIEAEIMDIMYYDALELMTAKKVIEVSNDINTIDETCNQIISLIQQHFPSNLV